MTDRQSRATRKNHLRPMGAVGVVLVGLALAAMVFFIADGNLEKLPWNQAASPTEPVAAPSTTGIAPPNETGPINTKSSGGAPASSPQGETPPGMQSAPEGSSATIRTDAAGIPQGTPKN